MAPKVLASSSKSFSWGCFGEQTSLKIIMLQWKMGSNLKICIYACIQIYNMYVYIYISKTL